MGRPASSTGHASAIRSCGCLLIPRTVRNCPPAGTPNRNWSTPKRNQPMLVFNCDECGAQLKLKDDVAGKKVRCPSCQAVVTAPPHSTHEGATPISPSPPARHPRPPHHTPPP